MKSRNTCHRAAWPWALFAVVVACLLAGCGNEHAPSANSSAQPAAEPVDYPVFVTDLVINLRKHDGLLDPKAVAGEVSGLLDLYADQPGEFDVSAWPVKNGKLRLSIEHRLSDQMRQRIGKVLDKLVASPSKLPLGAQVAIKITEKRPKVLKLLGVKTGDTFALKVAHGGADWIGTFVKRRNTASRMAGGTGYMKTQLKQPLADKIPSLSYQYGRPGGDNKVAAAAYRLMQTLGPMQASYEIVSDNPATQAAWRKLAEKHQLAIFQDALTLRWTRVDYTHKRYNPLFGNGDVREACANELDTTPALVFQTLLMPQTARLLAGYKFESVKHPSSQLDQL